MGAAAMRAECRVSGPRRCQPETLGADLFWMSPPSGQPRYEWIANITRSGGCVAHPKEVVRCTALRRRFALEDDNRGYMAVRCLHRPD